MKPLTETNLHGNKPLLGIIGGMGTQATGCFYKKLHSMQKVTTEQEYLDVLLYSKPTIPDRTAYITGQSTESPLEPLISVAKTLESAGATCIALPCVTSHYFYDDLSKAVKVPILHIPNETAAVAKKRGIKKVCVLATEGTIKGKVFHTAFEKQGIEVLLPSDEMRSELMTIIYDVKRGVEVFPEKLERIVEKTQNNGAEAVILGCTEFCVIAKENPNMINTLELLAKASITQCRGRSPLRPV